MDEHEPLPLSWNDELTDKEVYCLGKVVAHWGAIEHEVFSQTFLSFVGENGELSELPDAMRNVRFSNVLALWEKRVVNKQPNKRKQVLEKQLNEIKELKDMRNAIVHSMLHWSPEDIGVITAARVRNKEYITVKFTGDDLADFFQRLARINFSIRFPGGLEELAEQGMEHGGFMGRQAHAMFTGHKIMSDWPALSQLNLEDKGE